MKKRYYTPGLAIILFAGPTIADDHPSYQSYWDQVAASPGCKPADYADFTLVKCDGDVTLWYFTKANHPAHPSVIKRVVTRAPDGSWSTHSEGHWFAGSTEQAFHAWFAQIEDRSKQDGPKPPAVH